MKFECKGCTDRQEGCWSSCESYKAAKAFRAQLSQQNRLAGMQGIEARRARPSETVSKMRKGG